MRLLSASAFLIALSLLTTPARAQAPERMSYQAVVRDANDALVISSPIGMRISVLQGSDTGPAVYVETHAATTNANGLTTVEIGNGIAISGTIGAIDWTAGPYFLKTETDPGGGTAYSIAGTSPLMSVPYALYAANSGSSLAGPPGPPGIPGVGGCDPNNRDSLIVLYNNATAWGYTQDQQGVGNWSIHPVGNIGHSAAASKRSVVIYSNANAYAFSLDNAGAPTWTDHPLGGTGHSVVTSDRIIVLYNNATAFAFHVDNAGAGTWTDYPIGGTGHSHLVHGEKIVIWNKSNAFSFSVDDNGVGNWTTQPLGGTLYEVITTK